MNAADVDPARCPLCQRDNACGMAAGATSCWCASAEIPRDVIELIPPAARGVACVCRTCAERSAD